jgi:hypothetical protein
MCARLPPHGLWTAGAPWRPGSLTPPTLAPERSRREAEVIRWPKDLASSQLRQIPNQLPAVCRFWSPLISFRWHKSCPAHPRPPTLHCPMPSLIHTRLPSWSRLLGLNHDIQRTQLEGGEGIGKALPYLLHCPHQEGFQMPPTQG